MSPSPVTPPVAPMIAAQQVPLAQYAQQQETGSAGAGYSPEQQQQTSLGLVQSLLTDVGNNLEKVAKVLVVEKPEYIPILKSAVQALSMLTDEITKEISPDNGAATQAQQMPASGAVSAGM